VLQWAGRGRFAETGKEKLLLRQIVDGPRFALVDMVLVMLSGAIWMISPVLKPWIILIALLPWMARLVVGKFPYQRTRFDWLLIIFLITAWVAYWSAYDKAAAWNKIWLIVLAVLLYYALVSQPRQNLVWISFILFGVGVGTSIYFFLTHDFAGTPIGIVSWWMNMRPQLGWNAIHHGYISGILVITTLYSLYGISAIMRISSRGLLIVSMLLVLPGMGTMIGAFIFSISRGMWLAIAGAVGTWGIWKMLITRKSGITSKNWIFPISVLAFLVILVIFVYIGPAILNSSVTQSEYGSNTRSELFLRSAYFLKDYPFIGGGLGSFPGLYSQYLLVIPHHYFTNSYNLFLDVAIEQGVIGGLVFILIYVGSVWLGSQAIPKVRTEETIFLVWISLFASMIVIVHGMLYDYLYSGIGTFLLFLPIGFLMNGVLQTTDGSDGRLLHSFFQLSEPNIWNRSLPLAVGGVLVLILVLFSGRIRSMWYSNLGAVQMSQVELMGFPTGQWADSEIVPKLTSAEASLHTSLQLDPANQTANHRLGLISMLRADFESAAGYLEIAHVQVPNHRGIIKSLAYCYVWLGDMRKTQELLSQIPEAVDEMGVYVWWWEAHGRNDLSRNAAMALATMYR
jgi:hypothetical protein